MSGRATMTKAGAQQPGTLKSGVDAMNMHCGIIQTLGEAQVIALLHSGFLHGSTIRMKIFPEAYTAIHNRCQNNSFSCCLYQAKPIKNVQFFNMHIRLSSPHSPLNVSLSLSLFLSYAMHGHMMQFIRSHVGQEPLRLSSLI